MPLTTAGTVAYISPTIVKTFFKHYYNQAKKSREDKRTEATDEILFDEAFHIVKSFCDLGTHNTAESLQAFTNTHVPAPPWATVIPAMIPLESCSDAAKVLIDYFGPEDLRNVVGGEKWWQIRGIAGVQGEWIAQSKDWKAARKHEKAQEKGAEAERMKAKRDPRHERADTWNTTGTSATSTAHASQRSAPRPEINIEETDEEDDPTEANDDGEDNSNVPIEELDRLKRVMLYVHGGAYYWGSINTHRYQIIRFARKYGGRAFAVNYRKAPQYPWPCPLHDALAAYLYLIRPPADAMHKAVDPAHLVIAGDSAGGGLALALLTVIRDMDLPMPAGAVLISPWCDMTHSFPSILQNTATDIIPPYGFIHKPSTLWPVPATRQDAKSGDDAPPTSGAANGGQAQKDEQEPSLAVPHGTQDEDHTTDGTPAACVGEQGPAPVDSRKKSMKKRNKHHQGHAQSHVSEVPPAPKPLQSDPIRIAMSDPKKDPVELRSQIQLYATNAQLTHPLCSPVLHGSLGGLPPLYIIAGDGEVLRDEIVYLAHKAAHPERYPLSDELLRRSPRARENVERFSHQPTKVHLQIFDDMCHVLTLFAFTTPAKYAYRAIASFIKHVTGAPTNLIEPFPEVSQGRLEETASSLGSSAMLVPSRSSEGDGAEQNPGESVETVEMPGATSSANTGQSGGTLQVPLSTLGKPHPRIVTDMGQAEQPIFASPSAISQPQSAFMSSPQSSLSSRDQRDKPSSTSQRNGSKKAQPGENAEDNRKESVFPTTSPEAFHEPDGGPTGTDNAGPNGSPGSRERKETLREKKRRLVTLGIENDYTGQVPLVRPEFHHHMIRERVDIRGQIRPLEPESELQGLQVRPEEIGVIKEGPVHRYLTGQSLWDKKFRREAKRVEKRRAKNEQKALRILERAAAQGLLRRKGGRGTADLGKHSSDKATWSDLASFGPTDLEGETPPPSAIAGRRDTEDAIALLRTSLHMRAKEYGDHKRARAQDARGAPRQSAAEKQLESRPRHGLKIWNGMMGYLANRGATKAERGQGKLRHKAQSQVPRSRPGTARSRTTSANRAQRNQEAGEAPPRTDT